MRIKISLSVVDGDCLDYNHCWSLAEVIESVLPVDGLYTFSRVLVKDRKYEVTPEGMKLLTRQLYFFFSSVDDRVCRGLVDGLMGLESFDVGGVRVKLQGVKVVDEGKVSSGDMLVTLSPIQTLADPRKEGFVKEFGRDVFSVLAEKYRRVHGEKWKGETGMVEVHRVKPVRINGDGGFVRANLMVFSVHGAEELLRLGYAVGFGRMTEKGFGMVRTGRLAGGGV